MGTKEELLKMYNKWDRAIENNDACEADMCMSENWFCMGDDDKITTKAAFLEWITSGDLVHTKMQTSEIKIGISGDHGVVVAKGISEGTFKGTAFNLYEWSTNVFLFKDDRWQCTFTKLTPVSEAGT